MGGVPVVDVGPLVAGDDDPVVARAIDEACRDVGFFTAVGHGVDPGALARLEAAGRALFALPVAA